MISLEYFDIDDETFGINLVGDETINYEIVDKTPISDDISLPVKIYDLSKEKCYTLKINRIDSSTELVLKVFSPFKKDTHFFNKTILFLLIFIVLISLFSYVKRSK